MNDVNINPVGSAGSMGKKIVIGVVILLVLGFVGSRLFGKSASERAVEDATDGQVQVNNDGQDVTVKTDQGTYSNSNKLPDNFPSDVPVYPDATVEASLVANQTQDDTGGHYVGLYSKDSLDKVIAWYKTKVPENGWKVTGNATVNGGLVLGATKDKRNLAITVAQSEDQVVITLAIANQN